MPAVALCSQAGRLRCQPRHEDGGVSTAEAADPNGRHIGAVEQRRLTLAGRDQDRDRVGHEPADREQQRLRTGHVEPLCVVDQHGDRILLGADRQQAQRRGPDREPVVLRRARPQRKGGLERGGLRRRDRVQEDQSGTNQFKQGAKRHLRL